MMPEAAAAAASETIRRLHRLPKAELHVHLDGSLRPETLLALGHEYGKPLPVATAGELAAFMHVSDARDLVDYLARFDTSLSVLQTEPALERVACELATDLAAENVRYAEIRFCPLLNTAEGLATESVLDAVLRGLRRAAETNGIRTGIIVCALRHQSPATSVELAHLAAAFRDRGVVGFDLAGPEHGHPPATHVEAFRVAAKADLGVTIHAGEAHGPRSIREAVHICGARRIGHGTRLLEDDRLFRYINDFRIPIEICLTSNVQTRAVPTYSDHPLRRMYDAGLVVSLSTDNRLMSATTMTAEYMHAHTMLGFDWEELRDVSLMGFEAAFLPHADKVDLIECVAAELEVIDP